LHVKPDIITARSAFVGCGDVSRGMALENFPLGSLVKALTL
jgi:hypothetical protein